MNINITIDDITLNTIVADVVSFDEDGDPVVEGQKRVADLVADRIADRVCREPEYREMVKRVMAIRDEMIREKLEPALIEVMTAPIQKTNTWGEPTGEPTTMRELIIESSRELLSKPDRSGYNRAPWLTTFILDQVRILFEKELKADLDTARAALKKEITDRVAHNAVTSVTEALTGKI